MARLRQALYEFFAGYLPEQARQPAVVWSIALIAPGFMLAYLGAPLGAGIALLINYQDANVAGMTAVIVFALGNALVLVGMILLAISSWVDQLRKMRR